MTTIEHSIKLWSHKMKKPIGNTTQIVIPVYQESKLQFKIRIHFKGSDVKLPSEPLPFVFCLKIVGEVLLQDDYQLLY
jgi:hypothetical protein